MDRLFDALISLIGEIWPFGRVDPWETGLRVTSVPWFLDVLVSRRPGVPRLRTMPPGTHWVFPLVHDLFTVPAAEDIVNFPNQSLTTADGWKLAVSGGLIYQVVDVQSLFLKIQDYEEFLTNITMGLIAEYVSEHDYVDVTVARLKALIRAKVSRRASKWGIRVLGVVIHDLVDHKAIRLMMEEGGLKL